MQDDVRIIFDGEDLDGNPNEITQLDLPAITVYNAPNIEACVASIQPSIYDNVAYSGEVYMPVGLDNNPDGTLSQSHRKADRLQPAAIS